MLETLTKPRAVCYFVFRPKVFNSKLSERDLDLGRISHWQILLCYCFVQYSFCPPLLYLGVMGSGAKVSLRQNFCFLSLIQLHCEECQWLFWCGWKLQELVVSLSRNHKPLILKYTCNIKVYMFLLSIQPTWFVPASQIKMAFSFLHGFWVFVHNFLLSHLG